MATTAYERIGGETSVRELVERLYWSVLQDSSLAHFYAEAPLDRLMCMQFELISAALGGPSRFSDRRIADAHARLAIELNDLQRFMQHLFEAMRGLDLSQDECAAIVERFDHYANDIVRS